MPTSEQALSKAGVISDCDKFTSSCCCVVGEVDDSLVIAAEVCSDFAFSDMFSPVAWSDEGGVKAIPATKKANEIPSTMTMIFLGFFSYSPND